MVKAVILISVLVLGSTWTLQGVPAQDVEGTGKPPVDSAEVDSDSADAADFNATETCAEKPKIEGQSCFAFMPRFFYNSTSMRCEVFIYGGCGGNQNNFKSEKECLEKCHPEEVCKAASEIGPCKMDIKRYFYNSTSKSCEVFTYGGCGGNLNNFKSEKECLEECHPEEVCKAAPETGPCKASFQHYYYDSATKSCEVFIYGGCGGNQNNFETKKECLEECHTEG